MKKRVLCLLSALVMLLALSACGNRWFKSTPSHHKKMMSVPRRCLEYVGYAIR